MRHSTTQYSDSPHSSRCHFVHIISTNKHGFRSGSPAATQRAPFAALCVKSNKLDDTHKWTRFHFTVVIWLCAAGSSQPALDHFHSLHIHTSPCAPHTHKLTLVTSQKRTHAPHLTDEYNAHGDVLVNGSCGQAAPQSLYEKNFTYQIARWESVILRLPLRLLTNVAHKHTTQMINDERSELRFFNFHPNIMVLWQFILNTVKMISQAVINKYFHQSNQKSSFYCYCSIFFFKFMFQRCFKFKFRSKMVLQVFKETLDTFYHN